MHIPEYFTFFDNIAVPILLSSQHSFFYCGFETLFFVPVLTTTAKKPSNFIIHLNIQFRNKMFTEKLKKKIKNNSKPYVYAN